MLAWQRGWIARWFGGRGSAPPAAGRALTAAGAATPVAMQQLIAVNGGFPDPGGASAQFTIGMVESFAGSSPAYGAPDCIGGMLPIAQCQPLVAVIGLNFGGDGIRQIGLPDLRGRVAIGGAPIGRMTQDTLSMTWLIAVNADAGAPMLGAVVPFGGTFPPAGWAVCDGSTLPVRQNPTLFAAIGTTFGGTPGAYFLLPNLNGAAPISVGPTVPLGCRAPGAIDGLGLHYLINTDGPPAPANGNGALPSRGGYAGQVIAYAGAQLPAGWAACDGSMLAVTTYPNLFRMIGNRWGGDGRTSFGLPDLRGKMLPGA